MNLSQDAHGVGVAMHPGIGHLMVMVLSLVSVSSIGRVGFVVPCGVDCPMMGVDVPIFRVVATLIDMVRPSPFLCGTFFEFVVSYWRILGNDSKSFGPPCSHGASSGSGIVLDIISMVNWVVLGVLGGSPFMEIPALDGVLHGDVCDVI